MIRAGLLAALLALAGCATTTTADDVARVQALTHATLPRALADEAVDPLSPAEVRARLARPLTADDAVRLALANNRAVRAQLREVGVARGWQDQAGLPPNPAVELEVTPHGGQGDGRGVEVALEYDLTAALLAPLRSQAARPDVDAARLRAAGAVVALGYDVRAAFYAAQSAEARLALARQALDAFAAGRDAARALVEAGNVPALDAATQEAAYEDARVAVAQLELDLLDRREALTRLLGLSGADVAWTLQGRLPAPPGALSLPPRAEARALAASLELAELRSRMEGAARRAGLQRAVGLVPDVSVVARGEQEGGGWGVGGGLRVALPLLDRRQGAARAFDAELDALQERYLGLAVDLRSALRVARNRVASAWARARHLDAVVVPARRRVLAETLLQYNAMQVGVFPLLQARRDELAAVLSAVEARRDYWTAAAALDALLAGRRVAAPEPAASATVGAGGAPGDRH